MNFAFGGRIQTLALVLLVLVTSSCTVEAQGRREGRRPVLDEKGRFWVSRGGTSANGFRAAGWMPAEAGTMLKMTERHPADGENRCVRINMSSWKSPYWCGIVWSVPNPSDPAAGYWGKSPAEGWNLTGARRLVFTLWAPQPCRVQVKAAVLGREPYGDSANAPIDSGWLSLASTPRQYSIDVSKVALTRVVSGFCFVLARDKQLAPDRPVEFMVRDVYWDFGDIREETARSAPATEEPHRFYVYRDKHENGWVPANWMPEQASEIIDTFEPDCKLSPKAGNSCIRIRIRKWRSPYWAGIAWGLLDPKREGKAYWGEWPLPGWDLRGAKRVVFWARAPKPCRIQFKAAIVGDKPYGDKAPFPAQTPYITLTPEWTKYEIPLDGVKLDRVITSFCFVTNRAQQSGNEPLEFFLDEMYWETNAAPQRSGR